MPSHHPAKPALHTMTELTQYLQQQLPYYDVVFAGELSVNVTMIFIGLLNRIKPKGMEVLFPESTFGHDVRAQYQILSACGKKVFCIMNDTYYSPNGSGSTLDWIKQWNAEANTILILNSDEQPNTQAVLFDRKNFVINGSMFTEKRSYETYSTVQKTQASGATSF